MHKAATSERQQLLGERSQRCKRTGLITTRLSGLKRIGAEKAPLAMDACLLRTRTERRQRSRLRQKIKSRAQWFQKVLACGSGPESANELDGSYCFASPGNTHVSNPC